MKLVLRAKTVHVLGVVEINYRVLWIADMGDNVSLAAGRRSIFAVYLFYGACAQYAAFYAVVS